MNQTIETIVRRRSVRKYTDEPLTITETAQLKECALASPTARNLQPYRIIAVNDKEVIGAIGKMAEDILREKGDEASLASIKRFSPNLFYGAPSVWFIACEDASDWAKYDAGILAQTLSLAAESMGLSSVIVGMIRLIFEGDRCQEGCQLLGVPEGFTPRLAVAIGHGAETPAAKPRRDVVTVR